MQCLNKNNIIVVTTRLSVAKPVVKLTWIAYTVRYMKTIVQRA